MKFLFSFPCAWCVGLGGGGETKESLKRKYWYLNDLFPHQIDVSSFHSNFHLQNAHVPQEEYQDSHKHCSGSLI